MCKHRGGNLFSTWDIDGRIIETDETETMERERDEKKKKAKQKVQRARVFGNIILMGIRYHLLKMILQYLMTYQATHLRSPSRRSHYSRSFSLTSHCFTSEAKRRNSTSRCGHNIGIAIDTGEEVHT